MPTFTAIALDRLLEHGDSKSIEKSVPIPKPAPNSNNVPNSNLGRRNSTSVAERKVKRPPMKPELYITPESTPLPDSPSSFTPSPYIINHKRRGPRLVKSFSVDDMSVRRTQDEANVNHDTDNLEKKVVKETEVDSVTPSIPDPIREEHVNGVSDCWSTTDQPGVNDHIGSTTGNEELGSGSTRDGLVRENEVLKLAILNSERDGVSEDFFDPQEAMSYASTTDEEDNAGAERSGRFNTPMGEFFDACEELSPGEGSQSSRHDGESELRHIRLSLLIEIEKRRRAEESLNNLRSQWHTVREQLSLVGLTLPPDPTSVPEGQQLDSDPTEDLCRQVNIARIVSESIGRGEMRAEMEIKMEAQIESKNFEIARLCDRLHYYEAVNHEMSQRNQEAIEIGRRERLSRKRRQKWIWGSIAAAITLSTAALVWSFIPSGSGSSSIIHSQASSEHGDEAK